MDEPTADDKVDKCNTKNAACLRCCSVLSVNVETYSSRDVDVKSQPNARKRLNVVVTSNYVNIFIIIPRTMRDDDEI